MRRTQGIEARSAALVSLLAVVVGGCGGGGGASEADQVMAAREGKREPLAAEERFARRTLVTRADVRRAPEGSPERAFLEYWEAIDTEDYSSAMLFLSAELRDALDAEYLPMSLQFERQNNRPLKPVARSTQTVRGQTRVTYMTRTSEGKLRPTSVAMVERDGQWYVRYSATLDESYSAAVLQAAQAAGENATAAASEAARAQARTLEGLPSARP